MCVRRVYRVDPKSGLREPCANSVAGCRTLCYFSLWTTNTGLNNKKLQSHHLRNSVLSCYTRQRYPRILWWKRWWIHRDSARRTPRRSSTRVSRRTSMCQTPWGFPAAHDTGIAARTDTLSDRFGTERIGLTVTYPLRGSCPPPHSTFWGPSSSYQMSFKWLLVYELVDSCVTRNRVSFKLKSCTESAEYHRENVKEDRRLKASENLIVRVLVDSLIWMTRSGSTTSVSHCRNVWSTIVIIYTLRMF